MKNTLKLYLHSFLGPYSYEKLVGFKNLGYIPNIEKPSTFNEKISHRKFFQDSRVFSKLSNKIEVRDFVKEKVGGEYLTKIYKVFNAEATDIEFEELPDRFVLKSARGSGANLFFEKKDKNIKDLNRFVEENINAKPLASNNEKHYLVTNNYIFAEELLEDRRYGVPYDYKFFVFNGKVEFVQVDIDRFGGHSRVFYNREWVRQPFTLKYPSGKDIKEPGKLTEMIAVAESLAEGFGFVRVDLYSVNDCKVVFGEMTFMPGAGRERFVPKEWDVKLGELWDEFS